MGVSHLAPSKGWCVMQEFSRFTKRTAKRQHKKPCCFTGLPIEPGDRYTEYAGVYEGYFGSAKFLTTAKSIWIYPERESWPFEPDLYEFWVECLEHYLCRLGLSQEEAELCSIAARSYAVEQKIVSRGRFTCFVCRKRICPVGLFKKPPGCCICEVSNAN